MRTPIFVCALALLLISGVWADHFQIVPGRSIGRTHLGRIRRQFPRGHLLSVGDDFYADSGQGIAFEFARPPKSVTRCIAVSIYLPDAGSSFTISEQVRDILRSRSQFG